MELQCCIAQSSTVTHQQLMSQISSLCFCCLLLDSASFAFFSTALVLELSDLLLQIDLFEAFDLLLLLILTEALLDKWFLLDCKQIRSSSVFFSQVLTFLLKLKICSSIMSIQPSLSIFSSYSNIV